MTIWCDRYGRNIGHSDDTPVIGAHVPNLEGSRSLWHTSGRTHLTVCTARAYKCTARAWPIREAPSWPARESPRPRLPVWPIGQQSVIATDRT